mmetsp:Transcript_20792/g.52374  ORF Transcript_20792/g.52374 Transcript_20792/m.52374 type:complete len:223 (-) Transcript_20792:435-1103(-)
MFLAKASCKSSSSGSATFVSITSTFVSIISTAAFSGSCFLLPPGGALLAAPATPCTTSASACCCGLRLIQQPHVKMFLTAALKTSTLAPAAFDPVVVVFPSRSGGKISTAAAAFPVKFSCASASGSSTSGSAGLWFFFRRGTGGLPGGLVIVASLSVRISIPPPPPAPSLAVPPNTVVLATSCAAAATAALVFCCSRKISSRISCSTRSSMVSPRSTTSFGG